MLVIALPVLCIREFVLVIQNQRNRSETFRPCWCQTLDSNVQTPTLAARQEPCRPFLVAFVWLVWLQETEGREEKSYVMRRQTAIVVDSASITPYATRYNAYGCPFLGDTCCPWVLPKNLEHLLVSFSWQRRIPLACPRIPRRAQPTFVVLFSALPQARKAYMANRNKGPYCSVPRLIRLSCDR